MKPWKSALQRTVQSLPRPKVIWRVDQNDVGGSRRTLRLVRYKPSIHPICEPLFGCTVDVRDQYKRLVRSYVVFPSLTRRVELYRQALGIVAAFRVATDLFELAQYRRQVTNVIGVPEIDEPFMQLVIKADPAFSAEELLQLSERMPCRSSVRDYLKAASVVKQPKQAPVSTFELLAAAE